MKRLTALAHEILRPHLIPGGTALDATAGNGHDTAFLARHLGPEGRVYACDIQPAALEQTRKRLAAEGLADRVECHARCHASLAAWLPPSIHGRILATTFNLGYLPSGNHLLTTQSTTTIAALAATREWMAPEGILTVMAYVGHPGGQEECEAVGAWMETRRTAGDLVEKHTTDDPDGPCLFILRPGGGAARPMPPGPAAPACPALE